MALPWRGFSLRVAQTRLTKYMEELIEVDMKKQTPKFTVSVYDGPLSFPIRQWTGVERLLSHGSVVEFTDPKTKREVMVRGGLVVIEEQGAE